MNDARLPKCAPFAVDLEETVREIHIFKRTRTPYRFSQIILILSCIVERILDGYNFTHKNKYMNMYSHRTSRIYNHEMNRFIENY